MRAPLFFAVVLACAARAALAVTCGGFSIVPADHVIVKYSAALPTGATLTTQPVSLLGTEINVSRNVSGGSAVDVACVEDRVDFGSLGAGRFHLTWTDNVGFTSQRSSFTFFVGAAASGTVEDTSVLLPLLPDQPLRLEVNACSQRPAVAYQSGTDIAISQYGSGSGCKLYLLDLGLLPAGVYNVKTTRLDATTEPSSTSFRFIVQQPAATSACNGTFSIMRTTRGTARLHYEDQYAGYAPVFGLPAVTEFAIVDGDPRTTIVQPVADTGNTTRLIPGSLPATCHAEELDIPIPREGYNELQWWDQVSVNGAVAGYPLTTGQPVLFYWSGTGVVCSSFPRPISPSTAIEGEPVHVALSVMGDYGTPQKPVVDGQNVTINLVPTPYEGPVSPSGGCGTYDVIVGTLPAGHYSVIWSFVSGGIVLHPAVTSSFTVVKPPRQRGARHE